MKERHSVEIMENVNGDNKSSSAHQPSKFGITQVLVAALLIASFLLGSLYTKVQYLEKNGNQTQAIQPALQAGTPQTQARVPNNPQPTLGKQNVALGDLQPKGKSNAQVTIIAFEDFRCPFCRKFNEEVMPQLQKKYIDTGKVKFYYRNYQFLGPASVVAGNAGECANEQNKFWEFHDYLYKNQPSESDTSMYTTDKLTDIAGQLGMNTDQFRSCLDSKKYDKNVSQDLADGQKAGTNATPTFYINGQQLVGAQPYGAFQTIIDQELKR